MIAFLVKFLLRLRPSLAERNEIINEALCTLGALPTSRILTIDDAGRLLVRGVPSSIEDLIHLRNQASFIRDSSAWKLVRENLLFEAISKGVHEAQTSEQMLFSKAAIWNIQQMDELLATLQGPGNLPHSED